MLMSLTTYGQTRHGLIIGIGEYQDSVWNRRFPIHGDNDIPIIKDMLLKNDFTDIETLKNQEATFAKIIRSFEHLIKTVRTGDMVYIHFSCHGQQVRDFDNDEPDGEDECIIAYDTPYFPRIKYNADTLRLNLHLTDDILYNYLMRLKQKIGDNGRLIVVNDACHSGDGSRGEMEEDEYKHARSVPPLDVIYAPFYNYDPSKVKPIKWTYISACSAKGQVYETTHDSKLYGTLSWILAHDEELWRMPLNQLESTLQKRIPEEVNRQSQLFKEQTPSIESTNKETLQLF